MNRALTAILRVFPLDAFVVHPLERMEVRDDASIVLPHQERVLALASSQHSAPIELGVVKCLDFYERGKAGLRGRAETDGRPYGCFILQKGVVYPADVRDDGS